MIDILHIHDLLEHLDIRPVLLDIGASSTPPEIWAKLSGQATYVGFDPDRREVSESLSGHFARNIIINKAVTHESGDVTFYLTRSPFCSSTLHPDTVALSDYIFSDLFVVEDKITAQAITLDEAARELHLAGIDWIKTDSQGIDLRIYDSMSTSLRDSLLAIDIEPGLMHAYQGEDLFPEMHQRLLQDGFWLSDIAVRGTVRMRRDTLSALQQTQPDITQAVIESQAKPSPGWVEARYLRTLGWLREHTATQRAYALLWAFAVMDGQVGYALDIALEYRAVFGDDQAARMMVDDLVRDVSAHYQKTLSPPDRLKPTFVKRVARRLKRMIT